MRIKLITKRAHNFLLPENYPQSVQSTYWHYTKWSFSQYFNSSALGVLSTQQLLLCLGYSSPSGVLTASAALNWVFKDGLGQFGGVLYAGLVGKKFDVNTKHYKWASTYWLNLACFVELLSPLVPGLFLPLASMATVGKNISYLAGSASRAAINLSFCKENNLGDVTVKSGTQASISSLLGTAVGGFIGFYADTFGLSLAAFSAFSGLHLYSCYKALDYVQLTGLNPQRLDIVLNHYNVTGQVLDPSQVALKEQFIVNYKLHNLAIGAQGEFPLETQEKYILSQTSSHFYLLFHVDASSEDIIAGYISAARHRLGLEKIPSVALLTSSGWDLNSSQLSVSHTQFTLS